MKISLLYSTVSILILSPIPMLDLSATLIYPVDIENNDSTVRIYNIKIDKQDNQLVLHGLLKHRSYNTHVLPGRIDYIVRDINRLIIKNGVVTSNRLNLRRNRYPGQFKILLPN